MPANHFVDIENRLILTSWEGEAIDEDLLKAIEYYQDKFQKNPKYVGYNELCDFSRVKKFLLSTAGVRRLVIAAASTDLRLNSDEKPSKFALIINTTLGYSFARIYEAMRELANPKGKQIKIFKSMDEALVWLKND